MFLLDGLIKDLVLTRKIYGDAVCVKSSTDPVVHLLATPLLDSQTGTAAADILFDTARPSIIEVRPVIRGASTEEISISVCDVPESVTTFRNTGLEDAKDARKEAALMTSERILVFVKDRASFLDKFPSEYGRVSRALLRAGTRLDPVHLVSLVLGFMEQVIQFEVGKD